jgi:glucokinase
VAGLIPSANGGHVVVTSEAGHAGIPAGDQVELELVRLALEEEGSASAEMFVSGPGRERIYRYLARLRSETTDAPTSAEICRRATDGADPLAACALDIFCALLGSVASGVALGLCARGGVFLGGGILPRMTAYLRRSGFRTRFESSFRMSSYLAQIPTAVITAPHPALTGAAARLLAA